MVDSRVAQAEQGERSLHRWAVSLVCCTFLLILAGGLVTSRDAGLAVPDWPLSFGTINPPGWYAIQNVRTEHGHRLIAGCVSLLAVAVALRARRSRRPEVRRLAWAAVGTVLLQALLGGLRVLELSVDLAMVHGWLAQMFLCLAVALAVVTSPNWSDGGHDVTTPLPWLTVATTLVVVAQLVLGIVIRHAGAAARPLSNSAMFYWHVAGATVILLAAVMMFSIAADRHVSTYLRGRLRLLLGLVLAQIGLGIAAWLATEQSAVDRSPTFIESWVPTLHVGVGAAVLACSVAVALHAFGRGRVHAPGALQARTAEAH